MSEESPLLVNPTATAGSSSSTRQQQHSPVMKWMALSFALGGAATAVVLAAMNVRARFPTSTTASLNLLLSEPPSPGTRTINGNVPLPSEQDWCMAPGAYKFVGTYRASGEVTEDGLLYAPGRIEGTLLSFQDNDILHFHMVNLTYGNTLSPHHFPHDEQEHDLLDAWCILYKDTTKQSSCFSPKHYPEGKYPNTRCVRLAFPVPTPKLDLCRAMAIANFDFAGHHSLGAGDVMVEQWQSRLSMDDPDAPNFYDGQLNLYMRDAPPPAGYTPFSSSSPWKIPLNQWLTSDDQTLEASFQVMDWNPDFDFSKIPLVPEGCEEYIDVTEDSERPKAWTLDDSADAALKCPFGVMQRHLVVPAWHNHHQRKN